MAQRSRQPYRHGNSITELANWGQFSEEEKKNIECLITKTVFSFMPKQTVPASSPMKRNELSQAD